MKRKIILSLLILFLFSATGAVLATFYITRTTSTLGQLITLHQIEDLRQHLIISIQTVQSDLYTVHTRLSQKVDTITDNVTNLDDTARKCSGCHHPADISRSLESVQSLIHDYENALSYYITASADKQRIEKLKLEAASIGNRLLEITEGMSFQASQKLEAMTATAMERVSRAKLILFVTIAVTLLLGIAVAVHLTRSITGPVQRLVAATRAIASGDLSHTVSTGDKTEFGELAAHFNSMGLALKENYEELVREIAERRQAEEALRQSEERYALAARGANDGLWDWDLPSNRIHYSCRWKSMLGYGENDLGDAVEEWLDRVHADDVQTVRSRLNAHLNRQNPHFECEYRIRHRDGTYRWVLCRGLAVRDDQGRAYRMAGSQTDISARKEAERQLLHDAFHDALTGLPNRALFSDRLAHVLAISRRHPDHHYAVLFIDLDRFKVVNDSLGHTVGDGLLIGVGQRLRECLRPGDTVARLGGDEFAILLENITNETDAADVAQRIQNTLATPFHIHGHEVFASPSTGITFKSDRYERPEQVLRDADIAMYQAKAKGRARYEFFDAAMHADIVDRLQLESDLRSAVEHKNEFLLHYQPIVDLAEHRLIGFEALVRWNHPDRGMVYPLEFIPLAEETGMIHPLSEWVLREACRQLRAWQRQHPDRSSLRMSLNISGKLFLQPGFAGKVAGILEETGIKPENLAIEITESVIMEHTETAIAAMLQLQDMGVHIHIDDFGTGYSSLSYLHHFPVNALKIDRSFVSKMSHSDENHEIVKAIISLAQNLNLEVIAEGVEQKTQLSAIKSMDCQYGQGFIFSRPLPPDALDGWMQAGASMPLQ